MTVTTSRWAALIDALISTAGGLFTDVYVWDGPPRAQEGLDKPKRLWIGTDSADAGVGGPAADADQTLLNDRGMNRDETVAVQCIAEAFTADRVMKSARDNANAIVAALEVAIRPTGTSTASIGGAFRGELVTLHADQYQTESAAFCRITFVLAFTSYLGQS